MPENKNELYNITFKQNDDVLCAETRGKRTFKVVISIAKEIIEACKKYGTKRVLVDVRNLEGRLSTINAYNIPADYFEDFRDPEVLRKVAIIDLEEFSEQYKFFETVAVNRGYNLNIFSDVTKALEWLRSDR